MKGQRGRLTAQQAEFVRLVVEQGCSYVDAYRASYPARSGTRSAKSERVAAKRLAHRPHVEKRVRRTAGAVSGERFRRDASAGECGLGPDLGRKIEPAIQKNSLGCAELAGPPGTRGRKRQIEGLFCGGSPDLECRRTGQTEPSGCRLGPRAARGGDCWSTRE
jgi:hypothetical protein